MTEEQLVIIEDRSQLLIKIAEDLKKDIERLEVETKRLKNSLTEKCSNCQGCRKE